MPPCGFAYNVQPMWKNAKCLWLWTPYDSWPKRMTNGRIWMLGLRLTVATIIWGLNCFIKNVDVIVIIIIIIIIVARHLHFWNVCPTQGCDDILAQTFCHNSFGGVPSLNIQNVIIGVWLFILCSPTKAIVVWIIGLFLQLIWPVDESSIGGKKWFIEVVIMTSFDPTKTLGIEGLGRRKYWLIGAWLESESPSPDFFNLATLRLKGFRFTTWGALVLMIVCGPTPGLM